MIFFTLVVCSLVGLQNVALADDGELGLQLGPDLLKPKRLASELELSLRGGRPKLPSIQVNLQMLRDLLLGKKSSSPSLSSSAAAEAALPASMGSPNALSLKKRTNGFPWEEACAQLYRHCNGYFKSCCNGTICGMYITDYDRTNRLKRCVPEYFMDPDSEVDPYEEYQHF